MAMVPFNRDAFSSARDRASAVLRDFTLGQKAMVGLAVVAAIVGGVVFMRAESKPTYQPLFTNLQASDAGSITQQLTSSKIPYQLADGGTTILVPAADVDQERIALAEQGLPQGGNVGFSNLEKSGITTSDFVQQVEYQQALEGQLEQTIESIQGVQSAQVNLVVPQQSDFAIGSTQPTTASILVDLTPGTTLSSGQVQAIVHLAASSTPGLSASNVTVADNHGDVLTAPGDADGTSGASDSQQTDAYDNNLSTSLTSLLDRVVGTGNAAVQVNALLNFNQTQTTTNGLQTNAAGQPVTAPTGQTTSNSTYTGTGTPPSGVLGSSGTTTTNGNGTYTTTSSQVTNAVGQVTQTVKEAPGQVQKTSVAVLLNSSATHKVQDATIRSLVVAAAGLNLAGGDQLVVSSLPFAAAKQTPAVAAGAGHSQLVERAGEVGGLLLLIAAMVAVTLWASRRRRPLYQEIPLGDLAYPSAASLDSGVEQERDPTGELPAVGSVGAAKAAGAVAAAGAVGQAAALSFGPEAVLAQVNDFVSDRPAEAAALLRQWASDRAETPAPPKALPV
jgi:flagellar M-ring protein FliF